MNEMIFRILLSLKDDPRDADSILSRMQELESGAKAPSLASFYRGLKKAFEVGYLEILERAPSGERGRPRQLYRMTRAGRLALEAEARRLGRLAHLALSEAPATERKSR